MFCWNCGKEIEGDLLFCPHCAMKQAGIPEPKSRKKHPAAALVCIGVCAVVLLAVLTGILLFAGGEKSVSRPVDPYSVELPDLASFLNTQYSRDDVSAYTHYVICTLEGKSGREAAQEFVELLQQDCWQLVLDDSWDYLQSKALCSDYIFHYTGKGEGIKWVRHKDGYKYHAKVTVSEHTEKDRVTITFYTSPGFVLTDPGVDAESVS